MKINKKIIILAVISTSLLILFVLLSNKKEVAKTNSLSVLDSIPKNESLYILPKTEVVIIVNRKITLEDDTKINIKIEPEIKADIVYLENKIRISPLDGFAINTQYKISTFFEDNLVHNFTFKTLPISEDKYEEEGKQQAAADLEYNSAYKEYLDAYPWNRELPLDTTEYHIIYDFDKSSFRIRFKNTTTDLKAQDEIVKKAIEALKKIGVEEPINYYTRQPF